MPHEEAALSHR